MKLFPSLLFISAISYGVASVTFAAQASKLDSAIAVLKEGNIEQAIELFEEQQDNVEAMVYLAKIYMNLDLDEAEEWIEKAADKQPDNAEVHFWRGRVMGSQAQNSVFSALSYAGKSLDSLSKAAELQPDSVKYNNALMQFHIQAPSIAGGDINIAKQLMTKIKQLDVVAGTKAEIDLAFAEEDEQRANTMLNEAKQTYHDIPDFFFQAGMIQQRQENYQQAIAELSQAASKTAETTLSIRAKFNALYQIGRTSVLSESNLKAGIDALNQYITEVPDMEGVSPKPWAEFRLANLLVLNSQKPQAKEIYQRLAKAADKELAKRAKKAAKKI